MAFAPEFTPTSRPPKGDNNGLYLIVLLIILAVVAAVTYFIFQSLQPKEFTSRSQPVETEKKEVFTPPIPDQVVETKPRTPTVMEETPKPEIEPEPEPAALQYVNYTVRKNDMLTLIAKERYGTRYYWPLIYLKNERLLADQDGLQPGMHLEIPDSFDPSNPLHRDELDKATIAAYKNYKARGKVKKARWLLYGAHRYVNSDILRRYTQEIDPRDIEKVEEYISRFNP